jgi:hypothetical protein
MSSTKSTEGKSFFERMGEILNAPLPGTESTAQAKPTEVIEGDDSSLLARIKDILNTPLPGSETLNGKLVDLEVDLPEVTEADVQENWWETDWANFKAHQDQDRKGLNMKQRQDQEGFSQYQDQERQQFETYQNKEFEVFQAQQQAKLVWIQNQQLSQTAGVEVVGMLSPAPPVAPLAPEMPVPPWVKTV